jgi:hypothetical protein
MTGDVDEDGVARCACAQIGRRRIELEPPPPRTELVHRIPALPPPVDDDDNKMECVASVRAREEG